MCGIAGIIVANSHEKDADDFIKQSFVVNSLRGIDAAGIVQITPDKLKYWTQKLAIPGYMFMGDRLASSIAGAAGATNSVTICHTRSATSHGDRGHSGAHPFVIQKPKKTIIGVHNGTLTGWQSNANAKGINVDSEWAMQNIADKGLEAFKDFNGAYAFVWWDSNEPGIVNMCTNGERPLHFCYTKAGNLCFASEGGALNWLVDRNDMKREGNTFYLKPDTLFQFDIKDLKKHKASRLPKAIITKPKRGGGSSSVFHEVAAFLRKASGAANDDKKPVVTVAEIAEAKLWNLEDEEGEFIPIMYDEEQQVLAGTLTVRNMNYDMDAEIRGVKDQRDYTKGGPFNVKIKGVYEDEQKNSVAVCVHHNAMIIPAVH